MRVTNAPVFACSAARLRVASSDAKTAPTPNASYRQSSLPGQAAYKQPSREAPALPPQERAQAKDNARAHGKVKKVGGDEVTSPLNDDIGSGKAAAAGQARANAREAGNPGKTPGQYPAPPGTPGMPAAK